MENKQIELNWLFNAYYCIVIFFSLFVLLYCNFFFPLFVLTGREDWKYRCSKTEPPSTLQITSPDVNKTFENIPSMSGVIGFNPTQDGTSLEIITRRGNKTLINKELSIWCYIERVITLQIISEYFEEYKNFSDLLYYWDRKTRFINHWDQLTIDQ